MEVKRQRDVEPLKDLDISTYLQASKQNELEIFENEIALGGKDLGIPKEIMEIPFQAQSMLSFYCDREYANKITCKKTYNNILESYIASLDDDKWVADIFEQHEIVSDDGKTMNVFATVKDEMKPKYIRLRQKAISYWSEHKLGNLIDVFKKLMLGGRSREDLIKDDIIDDALYDEDKNFKLKRTNQAIKVLGLDKNVQMANPDVWNIGGGKQLHSHMKNKLGGVNYNDIIDAEFDEADKDE